MSVCVSMSGHLFHFASANLHVLTVHCVWLSVSVSVYMCVSVRGRELVCVTSCRQSTPLEEQKGA